MPFVQAMSKKGTFDGLLIANTMPRLMFKERRFAKQGYRRCSKIVKISKQHGRDSIEVVN